MVPRRSDRGAILVQVAIAIFVLTAFNAFVLDYGVMWLSRAEAQNAADAGALAGAVARAFDDLADPPPAGGPAYEAAIKGAQQNPVWGESAVAVPSWDCPPFIAAGGGCVRVDVYRNGTNGSNSLPTFFAPLFGVNSQGVLATATAQAGIANASNCLKPWAVPDKWVEDPTQAPPEIYPWDPTDTFDRYYTTGPNKGQLLPAPDSYTPPSVSSPGTGFVAAPSPSGDIGVQLTLKFGPGNQAISPGWYLPIDIPRADGAPAQGGERYRDNIANCNGLAVGVGTYLAAETGAKQGPTVQGIEDLIAQDPSATWDATTNSVDHSCAPACGAISPRVVALAVFDPDEYQASDSNNDWTHCPGGGSCVRVVNILGFFIAGVQGGGDVVGYLYNYPGLLKAGTPALNSASAFSKIIALVR